MSTFKASVQYGDWQGTAAADNGDTKTLSRFLEEKGLINENEYLLSTSVWIGENHDGKIGGVGISAYLYTPPLNTTIDVAIASASGPIPVRMVKLEISLEEYIGLFKRFKVVFTPKYIDLVGLEYQEI
jgi:hypothetical protein